MKVGSREGDVSSNVIEGDGGYARDRGTAILPGKRSPLSVLLVSAGGRGGGARLGAVFPTLKGTVQRKLTGVESDINRKVFLSH